MHARFSRFVAPFLIVCGLLAVATLAFFGGTSQTRAAASDDPAAVIEAYEAAVNAGDLDAILALYDDEAFHIALPSPDGSAGVCLGKEQFRMWYEQSLANGERVDVADGTVTVNGNQATFTARLSSEPWSKLGIDTLEATSEIVVIDGRIRRRTEAMR